MHQKIDTTISFYKFTNISNLEDNRAKIHEYLKKLNIYGTVIIASEGINANFCGSKVNIELCRVFISKLLNPGISITDAIAFCAARTIFIGGFLNTPPPRGINKTK